MSLYARSASLWAHLSAIRESLVNSDYVETTDVSGAGQAIILQLFLLMCVRDDN